LPLLAAMAKSMADMKPPNSDPLSADVCGLPQRPSSAGRDKLEEIASEFLDRLRAGHPPDVEAFARKHPSLAEEIREFLPYVTAMEDWKAQRELKSIQQPLPERFEIQQLGEFQIRREIARGGMGVVFEAEQPALGRRVAVKLLPWKFPKTSAWAEQFIREARIAARLQHAHIVPVYSFGEQEDRYFYAMQLIEGIGLDKLIERWNRDQGVVSLEDLILEFHPGAQNRIRDPKASRRWLRRDSWQQLAKIAAQVVSAMRYAHRQGTLHRDIKPANLLIDMQGKVWITDFGLAIGQEKILTDSSEPLAGTLRFMAPEQLTRNGDARSDLYAFGATLYELCTLQPAFSAKTRKELLQDIPAGAFAKPTAINPDVPLPLERIILKCMARDVSQRYQSAELLHADLLRFLNGSSEAPGGFWQTIRKWF
jgi:serine/threonine protein kinase